MKLVNLIPLKELDFRNQAAFDAYIKMHKMRPDTKVTIAGKQTTAGQASKNAIPVKGTPVFRSKTGKKVFEPDTKKPPKPKNEKYKSTELKELDKLFDSMSDWGGFGKYNRNPTIIAQVANDFGIDVNRILTHPEQFVKDSNTFGDTPLDYTLQAFGHTMYFAYDPDSAYNLVDLQMAYPLKYKSLSDEEWVKQMQSENDNPTTIDGHLRKYQKEENDINKNWESNAYNNRKSQAGWVKEQVKKNKKYAETMLAYQQMISKPALNDIDKMLTSNPPPPIKAEALYRGMAMHPKDLQEFIKKFTKGSRVELPISSFSSDPVVATGFANNVNNDNALIDKSNNQAVVIKVINSKNEFNGFSMNANIDNAKSPNQAAPFGNWSYQEEVLLPSNNLYNVKNIETIKLEDGRSITSIVLEQKGIKNEIRLSEFINNNELDILKKHLQYPNRLSLLYKKGE
jgi:hypothetical protein